MGNDLLCSKGQEIVPDYQFKIPEKKINDDEWNLIVDILKKEDENKQTNNNAKVKKKNKKGRRE